MSEGGRAREFNLAVLGTNKALHTIVVSLCKLYRFRGRAYRVIPPAHVSQADIVIVDADDNVAMSQWAELGVAGSVKPSVFIGAHYEAAVAELSPREYQLRRTRLSANLLKTLDHITVKDLKYLPELVIGGGSDADDSVSLMLGDTSAETAEKLADVLVVDDSVSVRTQMDLCLKLYDVAVDFAEDAERALELVGERSYDLVFLDVVLPEMDGYKACKLIKANASTRATPVVMLTGKTSPFNKVRGVMAGCDRYLTKPVDAEELKSVLQDYIPAMANLE